MTDNPLSKVDCECVTLPSSVTRFCGQGSLEQQLMPHVGTTQRKGFARVSQ